MSKANILIVEDEGLVAEDLANKLRRLGYDVVGSVASGDEAVTTASRVQPGLVLMDISLDGPMDGIQAAQAIRKQNDVPIIYLTAHSDPITLARAKITDPFGYILKPFEERDLATQIELALYKHQADRQLRQQREWLRVTLTSIGDAVIATDAEGRITFINPVAESLTGWKTEEAPGQPVQGVFRIVNEKTGQAIEEPVTRVLREKRAVELANHAALVTKDGGMVPIEDSAAPILDATGELVGVVLVFHDVTKKRRADEALAAALDTQREIAGATCEYVALLQLILGCMSRLTGAEGASLEVAEGDDMVYEAATGLAAEFVGLRLKVGQSLSGLSMTSGELVRADDTETDPRVDREACRRIGLRSMVIMPLRYDRLSFGVLKLMSSRLAGFGAAAEHTLRLMGEFLGVTIVRKRAEEALRQSEERLRLAQQAARIGTFEWNMQTNVIVWTSELEALYGLPPGSFGGTYEAWTALVHPDDLSQAAEPVQGPLISEIAESEWRVVWPDGSVRWLAGRARAFKDEAGKPVRMVGVNLDITARKLAEEELAAARQSAEQAKVVAEQANRAKDHFLAVLSHELRTPLTPVVMGLSMLQDRPDLDQPMRETLEMVRRNVEMESRLIDDLLDVSRIARGKVELTRSPVELSTVIHRAVEVCKPDIEERKLHFDVDWGSAGPYWIEADVSRLQQVFWNLLKNAIKFTPRGGCVGIRCRPSAKYVIVEVNDSGLGIEPEALSRIFNAFEQAERSITQQFGGLGLGLAISKALVDLHGGQIEAHSEGRGHGATFRVRLPLIAPPGQPEECDPAVRRQHAVRPLHVLLVEDHGVTAKLMRMVLTSDGHTVQHAGDVATALELADQHAFDLLVSDLGLPDGSGHDLMRQLRQRGHKFPGIALSGYGQGEDIQRSHEAGFAAHLTKPASRAAVVEAVASVAAGIDGNYR